MMIHMRTMPRYQAQLKSLFQLLIGLLIICCVMTGIILIKGQDPTQRMPAEVTEITVAYGDTLWRIAQYIAPDIDPRRVIWEIQTLNQIETTEIYPGQTLKVPVYN